MLPKRKHQTQKGVTQAHVDAYVDSLGGQVDKKTGKYTLAEKTQKLVNATLKRLGWKQPKA